MVATVDTNVEGRLNWNVTVADGESVQTFLPLIPSLVLPAGWLTAADRPPGTVLNGLEASGDGSFNATVTLRFTSGEVLVIEVFTAGLSPEEPGVVRYNARVSGSHPPGVDVLRLLPASINLREPSAGFVEGQVPLSGDVELGVIITYLPVDPSRPRPPLTLLLTVSSPMEDGQTLRFSSDSRLRPQLLPTPSPSPVPSPTPTPSVMELLGNVTGRVQEEPLLPAGIEGRIDSVVNGRVRWVITLQESADVQDYLAILPSLSLPYAWVTAAQDPEDIRNGLELSGNGRFTATVVVDFATGEQLLMQHDASGVSPQDPGLLLFTSEVSGSHPPSLDVSQLLPLSLTLSVQPSLGRVEGTATTTLPGTNVTISISYQPVDEAPARPVVDLTVVYSSVDVSSDGRVIRFSSNSTLQSAAVDEVRGTTEGEVGGRPLAEADVLATVDPNVEGRLNWNVTVADGESVQTFLPLIPSLVLPAGWLTAADRPPGTVLNGLEASGDGSFNATVTLRFTSGEVLVIEVFTAGLSPEEPGVVRYNARVSGSHPPGVDVLRLLPASINLREPSAGFVEGQVPLSGDVELGVIITYLPVDPSRPRPPLTLLLTVSSPMEDGQTLRFSSDSRLRPQLLPTPSPSPVPSPTPTPSVIELLGNVTGRVQEEPLLPAGIEGRIDSIVNGRVRWVITLQESADVQDYLAILPSLSLPYAWLTAAQDPEDIRNGLELSGNGRFTATVVVDFATGEQLLMQHDASGVSPQDPGLLLFTSEVSGSHPPGLDVSQLLPLSLTLSVQPSLGRVEGTATTTLPGTNVTISISYQPVDEAPARPVVDLTVVYSSVDVSSDGRVIRFSSNSTLQSAAVEEVRGATVGEVGGRPLAEADVVATVDPNVAGRLNWNVTVADGESVQTFLPLIPSLVLPAGWLTAADRPPGTVLNGLEASGDGSFNATVTLRFTSGEVLVIEVFTAGLSPEEPGVVRYNARVSGSHPPGVDVLRLLPASINLREPSAGFVEGQVPLSGDVELGVIITYLPVDPSRPRPPLTLLLTVSSPMEDGQTLRFSSDSRLRPQLLPTPSPSPVPSPTPTPSVMELLGNVTGRVQEEPLLPAGIEGRIDSVVNGRVRWVITLQESADVQDYLAIFPSLSLPYAWLTAAQDPEDIRNGLELSGNGRFTATVVVDFATGEQLLMQHDASGVSPQDPGLLLFTSEVSGSHPPGLDVSQLLPLSLTLSVQPSLGRVEGTATTTLPGTNVTISISYQPVDEAPARPVVDLTVVYSSVDVSSDGRVIRFSSNSTLQSAAVEEVRGTTEGEVGGRPLAEADVVATVDPNVEGRLNWNVTVADGESVQTFLPLIPSLALPAGWLTAADRPPGTVLNGLEASGDGSFNATVTLRFTSGEVLVIEVFTAGLSPEEPGVVRYNARVSGSHPPGVDVLRLLPASINLREPSAGFVEGQVPLSGDVELGVIITYLPVDPSRPRPPLTLLLTVSSPMEDGQTLRFSSDSRLRPQLLPTPSPSPVPSPTPTPSVMELLGNVTGRVQEEPLLPAGIEGRIDSVVNGRVRWVITLQESADVQDYLAILPSLSLPYAWLTAAQDPEDIRNGLELSGNGRFTATVVVDFATGEQLLMQHDASGVSPQDPGLLLFTSEVSGSHPPGLDVSQLLPLSLTLSVQPSLGRVEGTATTTLPGTNVTISISYQPVDEAPARPVVDLTVVYSSVDVSSDGRVIRFSSNSTLQSAAVDEVRGTTEGEVGGRPLAEADVLATVDPNVEGRLNWNVTVADGESVQTFLPLIPSLVLPAGWLTAADRPPGTVLNGLEASGDGSFNATVTLRFTSGEVLVIEVFTAGLSPEEPGVVRYNARVSGSHPPGVDVLRLLPASINLREPSAGFVEGQVPLSGDVELGVIITYLPVDPSRPRPPLTLLLTVSSPMEDGQTLRFSSDSRLRPQLLPTPSPSPVPSPTPTPSVIELLGNVTGRVQEEPLLPAGIEGRIDSIVNGRVRWVITLQESADVQDYLAILPSLSLPYAWLTAAQDPEDIRNGLELSGNGRFTATVVVDFATGEQLLMQHDASGVSPQDPGLLLFTSEVSGSHPPGLDVSQLLPLSLTLSVQPSLGRVEGTATTTLPGTNVTISISYQPVDEAPARPVVDLTVVYSSVDVSSDGRVIRFSSNSTLQSAAVEEVRGATVGEVGGRPLAEADVVATVDPNVAGRLNWNVTVADGESVQTFLPLIPSLVLPAGWLTAADRPPGTVLNGLEASGDGSFNATVTLRFTSGEVLVIEVFTAGLSPEEPGVVRYNARVSGSHPPGVDVLRLLPASINLREPSAGFVEGQVPLSGDVELGVIITYLPVDPSRPRPPLTLLLTVSSPMEDGQTLRFSSDSRLRPQLLPTPSPSPVPTPTPSVMELLGNVTGRVQEEPLLPAGIEGRIDSVVNGRVRWVITLQESADVQDYLAILPSLSLPYAWLTASQDPEDIRNGLELSGNGRFTATVVVDFATGEQLLMQHDASGVSPQDPGLLLFTSEVSGSHPPGLDVSQLLPLSLTLSVQPSLGRVEGTATTTLPGTNVTISISYQPVDEAPARPVVDLTVVYSSVDVSSDGRVIRFSSNSTLQSAAVEEVRGTTEGEVGGRPLAEADVVATVDPNVEGRLNWNVTVADGESVQTFLPLIPSLVLPAGWLTAADRPPGTVLNGLEASGDGSFNATVTLRFTSGEVLVIEVFTAGLSPEEPGVVRYNARVSGSHPPGVDVFRLLPASINLREPSAGFVEGQVPLSGDVELGVIITYLPVDPSRPRPPLTLLLTVSSPMEDGQTLRFSSDSRLRPQLLPTPSPSPVPSPTPTPSVMELLGNVTGRVQEEPLLPAGIEGRIDSVVNGRVRWVITLQESADVQDYLAILPSLSLPYAWLTAAQDPEDIRNGLELSGNGRFTATVVVDFATGEQLLMQHDASGVSPQDPGLLLFTSEVSGSHPPGLDVSQLLPLSLTLSVQPSLGRVEGTATTTLPRTNVTISISYQPVDEAPARPVVDLTVVYSSVDVSSDGRVIRFSSNSTLQSAAVEEVRGTTEVEVGGRPLAEADVVATVDTNVEGRLNWNVTVADGESVQTFLPLIPSLVLPAGWLTAADRPPGTVLNGLEASGDGSFNATVTLRFTSGEVLVIEVFTAGLSPEEPGVVRYNARVSGSHPPGVDVLRLLPASINLREPSGGFVEGQVPLSGDVELGVIITYLPVDPSRPRPPLTLLLTVSSPMEDGQTLRFSSDSRLRPQLLPTPSPSPVPTPTPSVMELLGNVTGRVQEEPLLPAGIEGRIDSVVNGRVRWVITLQESADVQDYLAILPSLSLPYAWLTAAQDPEDIRNGLELSGNGRFTATVVVDFATGEQLLMQHDASGVSPQDPGLLLFTSEVSGSHPPGLDVSQLLPLSLTLSVQPSLGRVEGTATTTLPGTNVTISISYQPVDEAPARPVVDLTVVYSSVDVSSDGRVIRFSSNSTLQSAAVEEVRGTTEGEVGGRPLAEADVVATVDPNVEGRLNWNVTVADGESVQTFLPLIPSLVLPAGWLTAADRPPGTVLNGLEASGDGSFNATVTLRFTSGEVLVIEVFTAGLSPEEPGVVRYNARVSGSHPPGVDVFRLLPASINLREPSAGFVEGQVPLSGDVELGVIITYLPVDPSRPRPPLTLLLTVSSPMEDGQTLRFSSDSRLRPQLLPTPSPSPVPSPTPTPSVMELLGNVTGRVQEEPLLPAGIEGRIDSVVNGRVRWVITLQESADVQDYLAILPSLSLPYAWLTAAQDPEDIRNGLELSGNGRFTATVVVDFATGEQLLMQHDASGVSPQDPGLLLFTSEVSGSHPPGLDVSQLLPLSLTLSVQPSLGRVEGTATTTLPGTNVTISISYQPVDEAPARPVVDLTVVYSSVDVSSDGRVIRFSSNSTLQSAAVEEVRGTTEGEVGGRPLAEADVVATVDPNVESRLNWNVTVADGESVQTFLPLIPSLVLPAGWLTAADRPPGTVLNGLEASGDGSFNATVTLRFTSGEVLVIEVFTAGLSPEEPGVVRYNARVSGSHPPGVDVFRLLPASINLREPSAGFVEGQVPLSGDVELGVIITYLPVDPSRPRPPLTLLLTVSSPMEDDQTLRFSSDSRLRPQLLPTPSPSPVPSPTPTPSVMELLGNVTGRVQEEPLLPAGIEGRIDSVVNGRVRWVITLQESADVQDYLAILPSLSLPYAWLTAAQDPEDIRNGLELSGNGRFTATVVVDFATGEQLLMQHDASGVSPQDPGLLLFTSEVSGSHPPGLDVSQLLPLSLTLSVQPSLGRVEGTATTTLPGTNVTISISYQPVDEAPARPVVDLTVVYSTVDVSSDGRVIRFSSNSTLQSAAVEEVRGTTEGEVGGRPLAEADVVATVDPNVEGRLNWNVTVADGESVQTFLPLIPSLVLPAGWLTAADRPPGTVLNGLEASGDGSFNATVTLRFTSGEVLVIEVCTAGLSPEEPGVVRYNARVSGSHPPGVDVLRLLPASINLREPSAGFVEGQVPLSGDVELGVIITYLPVDPSRPRPPLTLLLTVSSPMEDGQTLRFSSDSRLRPQLLPTPSPSPVPSPTPTPSVMELLGNVTGRVQEEPLLPAGIEGRIDSVVNGRVRWVITLQESADVQDYLAILPSLSLPYAWLTAAQDPEDIRNGLELSGNGRFTATVVVDFATGEQLLMQHDASGVSPQDPGLLLFTSEVSGSHPPGLDVSQLLPLSLTLSVQPSLGRVEGTATTTLPGTNVTISISYQPVDEAPARPVVDLTVVYSSVDVSSDGRVIRFSSNSTLQSSAVEEVRGTTEGEVGGRPLAEADVVATVDPNLEGRLNWNVTVADGESVQTFLPLIPALVLPAGWLTTADRPPGTVLNGLEASGDGNFNATVTLRFTSGEVLIIEVFTAGLSPEEPGVVRYNARVSGSHPPGVDVLRLFPASINLREPSAGFVEGQVPLSGDVELGVIITYLPVDPSRPRPPLTLLLTVSSPMEDGQTLRFSSDSRLRPQLLPTPSPSPVPSPTPTPSVMELLGNVTGRVQEEPLLPAGIEGRIDSVVNGRVRWVITLQESADVQDYLAILPSLSLPYAWLTAAQDPEDIRNGLELSGNGRFTATVVVDFATGEQLLMQHDASGVSPQDPGLLLFTSEVSGSHPPGLDVSQLLPLSLTLSVQPSLGRVEGTATTTLPGTNVTISISYQPVDEAPARPVVDLTVVYSSVDVSSDGRVIRFSSNSTLQSSAVEEVRGTTEGEVGGRPLAEADVVATVDPNVEGRLNWNVTVADGESVQTFLPLIPALVLPAGWLTTADRPPGTVLNGLEASGDGSFNATVTLRFTSGEVLIIEVFTAGLSPEEPGVVRYNARVSGSHPPGVDVLRLFPASINLREPSAGFVEGQVPLSGDVELGVIITYLPVDPSRPRPPLTLLLTVSSPMEDGQTLRFSSDSRLRPQLLPTPSPSPVPSPTPTPTVMELLGNVTGRVQEEPLLPAGIEGRIDSVVNGRVRWVITLQESADVQDYLAILPSLSLPYAWLTAAQDPEDIRNGLELSGNGRFTATVVVDFATREQLLMQHDASGVSPQDPGLLLFTSEVSGSHPPGLDVSQLLPLSLTLSVQPSLGRVEGTATTTLPGTNVTISISYHPVDEAPTHPVVDLTVVYSSVDVSSDGRVIRFSSNSTLQSAAVEEVRGTTEGEVGGRPLAETEVVATVDPDVEGRLIWNVRVADGESVQTYLPLIPSLVLPAGWLTAADRPPGTVLNGLEASGDGSFNATVTLRFTSGEVLITDVFTTGLSPEEPGVVRYNARVSGSHPPDVEIIELLPVSLRLQELSTGSVEGQQLLRTDVELTVAIIYNPVDLSSARGDLILEFTLSDTQVEEDGFTFTSQALLGETCFCNGLADVCDLRSRECINCELFTTGKECEVCLPGYVHINSKNISEGCQPCLCPGLPKSNNSFSESCVIEGMEIFCTDCEEGYTGSRCDICDDGYYGTPTASGTCRFCECSGNIDLSQRDNCNRSTGECLRCINNTAGQRCEVCRDGYWGDAINGQCKGRFSKPLNFSAVQLQFTTIDWTDVYQCYA